jgi:PKD repeat protein
MASRGALFLARVSARPREAVRAVTRGFPVRPVSRGQSLVEFALVAPVMLLLTLTALDFGRVYLGWINLQTATRAAANFAANNSTAWLTPQNTTTITQYRNQVINDTKNTNCALSPGTPADPVFSDGDGNGTTTQVGDRVTVSLTCNFGVITPIISNILGNTIHVSSSALFPVKSGQFATSGGTAPVASFTASPTTTTTGSNVAFTDSSTGSPTTWQWDFGDTTPLVNSQNPTHAYTAAGTYSVTLTVTNASGSNAFTRTNYIVVSAPPPVADFTASTTTPTTGATVTFTGTSTGTPTNWAWTFGDGGSLPNGTSIASHAYNTAGTYTVTLVVTTASGSTTVTKANYIVVSTATCTVPDFVTVGTRINDAPSVWSSKGFTSTINEAAGHSKGNYKITFQSIVAGNKIACNSTITVNG